ncbi:MAG: response regulator [Planctomycetota bacterium]
MDLKGFRRHLDLTARERDELLDALDADRRIHRGQHERSFPRHQYRVAGVPLVVDHPDGGQSAFLVDARNLSRGGISVLHGGYLHVGSHCRVSLRDTTGNFTTRRGVIVACRLIRGAAHEIGIQFASQLDLKSIIGTRANRSETPPATSLPGDASSIVVADPFEPDRRLHAHLLTLAGYAVHEARTPGQVLDAVRRDLPALIVLGVDPTSEDALRIIPRLRQSGFDGPILLMTADGHPGITRRLLDAGATSVLIKPFSADVMLTYVQLRMPATAIPSRLLSTRATQPGCAALLDAFIPVVCQLADGIERARAHQDRGALRDIALQLKGSGLAYGYPDLTVAAIRVLTVLRHDRHDSATTAVIDRLVQCCESIVSAQSSSVA